MYFNNVPEGRRILILGKSHSTKNICNTEYDKDYVENHDWLYNLILNTEECIYLFVERPYLKTYHWNDFIFSDKEYSLDKYAPPLSAIEHKFRKCNKKIMGSVFLINYVFI